MADDERDSMNDERERSEGCGGREGRVVAAETVVDIPETLVDDGLGLVLVGGDIAFDEPRAIASGGRIARCAQGVTFTIHGGDVLGSGSQGVVVRATDASGASYAAKISYPVATARDRRNRKAVLDSLITLMDDHPLGAHHFRQTHLMPVYAYGKVAGQGEAGAPAYDVAIMALCERSLGDAHGCSYDELREAVLPQTADGLRFLHVQGIVHRDIKPKNLYFLDGSIVLGDYGISSLLEEGKDTSATVFDKRTPGYSPHSSVIQRENDWYALGYTLWTLYNGGVHPHQALIDAGDLSAVLAGSRPVEFIPKHPDEAPLGELIYGLTLESSRGRLGYDDIQEWLAAPEAFTFASPFDEVALRQGYQFQGRVHRNNAELADAMVKAWDDAKDHVYSQTLEEHCKRVGQHDLAVALHRVTATDPIMSRKKDAGLALALTLLKGSEDEFAWQGGWRKRQGVADRAFERLSVSPFAFYSACSDRDQVTELLSMLRVAYADAPGQEALEAAILAACDDLGAHQGDPLLVGDGLLVLFEALCNDKRPIREFFRDFGMHGNAVWVKRHIEELHPTSSSAREAVRDVAACSLPKATSSMSEMREQLEKLEGRVSDLSALLPSNPFERLLGLSAHADIEPSSALSYGCAEAYGERCTIGYALTAVAPEARDGICAFDQLRQAATAKAQREARRIKEQAARFGRSRLVDGRSPLKHLFLMACIVAAWVFGCDLLVDAVPVCKEAFIRYEPLIASGGGIAFEDILPGVSCIDASLALVFAGFTMAALCVLLKRIAQLAPVALGSSLERHASARSERMQRKANELASQPLSASINTLLSGKPLPSPQEALGGRFAAPRRLEKALGAIDRVLRAVYGISVVALMAGVVGATAMSMPYLLFQATIVSNPDELPLALMSSQGTLVLGLAIYFAAVLRPSRLRPSMIAVVLIVVALIGLCAVCQGPWLPGLV